MAYAHAPQNHTMSEMNITPLVDVMLVMLVIFMISAPVFTQVIPRNTGESLGQPLVVEPIALRIEASGEVFMDGQPAPLSALGSMLAAEAARAGQVAPTIELDANGNADYQVVAKVLALAQKEGLDKIRFVTRL